MIIPAQVPRVGMPVLMRSANASNTSNARASLTIVVDSPPGMTSASHRSSSSSRRTGNASAPRARQRDEVLTDVTLQGEDADRLEGHSSSVGDGPNQTTAVDMGWASPPPSLPLGSLPIGMVEGGVGAIRRRGDSLAGRHAETPGSVIVTLENQHTTTRVTRTSRMP